MARTSEIKTQVVRKVNFPLTKLIAKKDMFHPSNSAQATDLFMLKQPCVSAWTNHHSIYLRKWQVNYLTSLGNSPFIDALTLGAGPQGLRQARSLSDRNEQPHMGQLNDAICFKPYSSSPK